MNILYLASQSSSRKKLLEICKIPFKIIAHKSDEQGIKNQGSFNDYVLAIAQHKMELVDLSSIEGHEEKVIFVLTADTLIRTHCTQEILGKPADLEDGKRMLRTIREQNVDVATGCCLEKKQFTNGEWKTIAHRHWSTTTTCEFCVDENNLDLFFAELPWALKVCGAGVVDDFGLNYLKSINGSFTSAMGLPMFELRQELTKLGFWS